jgi:hypothetical protein
LQQCLQLHAFFPLFCQDIYTGLTNTEPEVARINATDFLILLYQMHGRPDFSMEKLMNALIGHTSPGEGKDGNVC